MARIESLGVLLTTGGSDFLAEEYGKVIANVQKRSVAARIKNTSLSGSPTAGTVEAKRFENRSSNDYGTARAAGKGQQVKTTPVIIAIDQDRELITEVEQKDVSLYGVDNFIQRQAAMDEQSMLRELDTEFFSVAANDAKAVTPAGSTPEAIAEAAIQAVETVKNKFVHGVPRDMIHLVCAPSFYGELRTYLDKIEGASGEAINVYHGVQVHSEVYLPAGIKCLAMIHGAVAQPVMPTVAPAQKVPLSNAYAFGLFYSYGTKTVMSDLIFKVAD